MLAKSVYAKMYAINSKLPHFFFVKSILTHALGKPLGAIKGS